MEKSKIRNFCIIAHIDHGKSTLADRFLELTRTVSEREMKAQLLDMMDLERERGITIKLQPATMAYQYKNETFILNLIDTPGHVDFNYEVSRSLAAVEGALLLVDATQGIQAQTLTNLYLALDQGLEIIPVINKIDLPMANVEKVKREIINLIGCKDEDILAISAKTGQGIEAVLQRVIDKVSPPKDNYSDFRALIFDAVFNEYKGVINYIRVFDGEIRAGQTIYLNATGMESEVLEVGIFTPNLKKENVLQSGQIGYVISGIKEIDQCKVGDTIFLKNHPVNLPALAGYKDVKPMVFASFFTDGGDKHNQLRNALEKLKLNDASLVYEPEHSLALGSGFRCGFLGLLHLDIIQERLTREYDLQLVVTVPSVAYKVTSRGDVLSFGKNFSKDQILNDKQVLISNPAQWPDPTRIEMVEEPMVRAEIVTPQKFLGAIMQLAQDRHGVYLGTDYLDSLNDYEENRVVLKYELPLSGVIVDFYDQLKSISSGYASFNYEFIRYQAADIVRLMIYIAEEPVEALSIMVYREAAHREGKRIVEKLKTVIPKQLFVIKVQAILGGKIVASEKISALRKDVTAKLYGGDVTRKMKLLNKQKEGKKRMAQFGKVKLPQSAYLALLKKD